MDSGWGQKTWARTRDRYIYTASVTGTETSPGDGCDSNGNVKYRGASDSGLWLPASLPPEPYAGNTGSWGQRDPAVQTATIHGLWTKGERSLSTGVAKSRKGQHLTKSAMRELKPRNHSHMGTLACFNINTSCKNYLNNNSSGSSCTMQNSSKGVGWFGGQQLLSHV